MIWVQISGRTCNAGCTSAPATAGCGLGTALLQGRSAQPCWNSQMFCCRTICAQGLAEIVTMVWSTECMGRNGTIEGKIMTASSFIHFTLPHSLYMVGQDLPRSLALHFVPICPESASALIKDKTLCHLPSSSNGKISHGILLFLFLWRCILFHEGVNYHFSTFEGRRQKPTCNDFLKHLFYYIHDPVFSPHLTTASSTKVGSLTRRTFCMGKYHTGKPNSISTHISI